MGRSEFSHTVVRERLFLLCVIALICAGPVDSRATTGGQEVHIDLPEDSGRLEGQALKEEKNNLRSERLRFSSTFLSQSDVSFSDSFARSRSFESSRLPRLELGIEYPREWSWKKFTFGPSFTTGMSLWSSSEGDTQHIFDVPFLAGINAFRKLSNSWGISSRVDVGAGFYWSDRSYEFSGFSGWGWTARASLGLERSLGRAALQTLILATHENRARNRSTSFGLTFGWGIYL